MTGFSAVGRFAVGHFAVGQFAVGTRALQNTKETIAKYADDANLFRLGSTNPKKRNPTPVFFVVFFRLLYRGLIVGRLLSGWLLSGGF